MRPGLDRSSDTVDRAPAAPRDAADGATCRQLTLCLPRGGVRRWHLRLAEALHAAGIAASVSWVEAAPSPAGMDSLFALERLLHRRPGPRLSERVDPADLALPGPDAAKTGALRLALPGAAAFGGDDIRHIHFDGCPGETGLVQALLRHRAPLVEITDAAGSVLARGRPSLEMAATLCEAYEAVASRTVALVVAALLRPQAPAPAASCAPDRRGLGAYALRQVAHGIARRLFHLCFYAPHWRVGWRFTEGATVWDGGRLDGASWRVLPDPGHRFYADPFPFHRQGRTHLFVEDLDHRSGRGVISALEFGPDGPVGPMRPVLEEPFHLSYPFVFAHRGEVWMIPETSQNRTVSLYRAAAYPDRWVRERDLLTGLSASDATVIRHGGHWWMFATLDDGEGGPSDTLGLFMAHDLFGPWTPHPANPLLIDAGSARPAGAMVIRGGRLWRPVQDCTRLYGGGLALAEVTTLTQTAYVQEVRQCLRPGPAWPGRRLHTLNVGGGVEVIDGSAAPLRLFRSA